jgi:hypothetical protein
MAWETRNGKGRYYTRSRRVNGKVVREYFGSGPAAEQAALDDALERLRRSERRRKFAIDQVQRATEQQRVEAYCQWVEVVMRAELVAAGYHYHRGEWRKRRELSEQPSADIGWVALSCKVCHWPLPVLEWR